MSQVNRIIGEKAGLMLEDSPKFYGTIGCEIIERNEEMITVPRREYEAMATFAKEALEMF